MCTSDCFRPRDAGLSSAALDTLAGLYEHPVVRLLANAFRGAGGQLFVVGGPVRDALRGHADFADLDFTTNLRPAQTRRALRPLGTLWTAGERFGTLGVSVRVGNIAQKVEITTFRTEVYTEDSRKPEVGFGDHIVDDLRRRDLTVNAIAMNVVDGCLIDPFDGIAALGAGMLDTPDDPVVTLSEDPLRILRAIRFAARLDAQLSDRLISAANHTRDRLSIVAAERRLDELEKLTALGPAQLRDGLLLADTLGVLETWVPGSSPVAICGVDITVGLEEALTVLLSTSTSPASTLRTMKASVATIRRVERLLEVVGDVTGSARDVGNARRILRTVDDETLAAAERVHRGAFGATHPHFAEVSRVAHDEPGVRAPLPVGGSDLVGLGLKGPAVGAALARLEARFCAEGQLTRAEALDLVTPQPVT